MIYKIYYPSSLPELLKTILGQSILLFFINFRISLDSPRILKKNSGNDKNSGKKE